MLLHLKNQKIPSIKVIFSYILSQWLLIGIGIVIVLAYFFPNVGRSGGTVRSEYSVGYACVALIFFVSGLSIPREKLLIHLFNFRLHLIVQITSFFTTSSFFFALAALIRSTSSESIISTNILAGFIVTGCIPTTIASNVVMTRTADGDVAATLVEVLIGNLIGPFLSPVLITNVYLSAYSPFRDLLPKDVHEDVAALYRNVLERFGLTLFLPLFVGQLVLFFFPKPTTWAFQKLYLGKLSSLCLLALIWSTFCGLFASNATQSLPAQSIVLDVLLNLVVCASFTVICFYLARPPKFLQRYFPRLCRHMPKDQTVAVCFCGPAKTQALGIPMVASMWGDSSETTQALIQLPVVLYTAEQILIGQIMVPILKRWVNASKEKDAEIDNSQELGNTSTTQSPSQSQASTTNDEIASPPVAASSK